MSVVIDQVETEVGGSAVPQRSADIAAAAPGSTQAPDGDRLAYHLARRRHRVERLWAD